MEGQSQQKFHFLPMVKELPGPDMKSSSVKPQFTVRFHTIPLRQTKRCVVTEEKPEFLEREERVNNYQCDFDQRIKPEVLFQFMTDAAGSHSELLGYGFKELIEKNFFWVLSRLKIQFFQFPRFGDQITIRTWPKTIQQKLFFIRDFEILADDGTKLAAATSAWLVIDANSRRMVPTAAAHLDLPSSPEKFGIEGPLEKIGLHGMGQSRLKARAGYSVVDMQGHVNNSRYIQWICDCFPWEMYTTHTLDWLQINYDHEILPGEEVELLVDQPDCQGSLYSVEGMNRSNGSQAFECLLNWRSRD
jgi:acyl-ACP thioesterase